MRGQTAYNRAGIVHSKLYAYPSRLGTARKRKLYAEYLDLLKKAAYTGHPDAQFDFAQQFEDMGFLGLENPKYNVAKLAYWYTKAGNNGHAEAHNNLAHLYEKGEGVPRNLKRALQLYKKSGELGSFLGKENYKKMIRDMAVGGKYHKERKLN